MADDEPSVPINYERESIHAGDDPIPLTIEFPARVTTTDLLVTFAERQSRFFAYRRARVRGRFGTSLITKRRAGSLV
jgi:hypothetical protein